MINHLPHLTFLSVHILMNQIHLYYLLHYSLSLGGKDASIMTFTYIVPQNNLRVSKLVSFNRDNNLRLMAQVRAHRDWTCVIYLTHLVPFHC